MAHYGKWAKQIIDLQQEDGSWGSFHTLSSPYGKTITTEQALRRLHILGFTQSDEPIARAMAYMETKLKAPHPTVFMEKTHDSKTYGDLMLAAWLRLFDPAHEAAGVVAAKWAAILAHAFRKGTYDHPAYVAAYESIFGPLNPRAGCLANFVVFYQMTLLADRLDPITESAMLDYVIAYEKGIYYLYDGPLNQVQAHFASKEASRYLSAMEVLSAYRQAPGKLAFVVRWLQANEGQDGQWDMGQAAKDGIHFPLSDDWRRVSHRKRDCTARIQALMVRLWRSAAGAADTGANPYDGNE